MKPFDYLFNLEIRKSIGDFLNNHIGIFDLWFIVHFFFGGFIYLLLRKDKKNALIQTFILLVFWELFEFTMFQTNNRFFIPETILNQGLDIIIGMFGAILAKLIIKRKLIVEGTKEIIKGNKPDVEELEDEVIFDEESIQHGLDIADRMDKENNMPKKCPKCESINIRIEDDSFDYGAGHHGSAGTEIIKYPVCNDCDYGASDGEDDWEEKDEKD